MRSARTHKAGVTEQRLVREVSDALEAQKKLSHAQLMERQNACTDEGAKLPAASNGLERVVVRRPAKKRMDRLLGN